MNVLPKEFPFTVHPRRSKALLVLLICLAFVSGGILMIRSAEPAGWFVASFFGMGVPVSLISLHPKSSYLTVDYDGFEYAALFRRVRMQWTDISEFGVTTLQQRGVAINRSVAFNFSPTYPHQTRARALARSLSGYEGALPDTYGFSADELSLLLSACHKAFQDAESPE